MWRIGLAEKRFTPRVIGGGFMANSRFGAVSACPGGIASPGVAGKSVQGGSWFGSVVQLTVSKVVFLQAEMERTVQALFHDHPVFGQHQCRLPLFQLQPGVLKAHGKVAVDVSGRLDGEYPVHILARGQRVVHIRARDRLDREPSVVPGGIYLL